MAGRAEDVGAGADRSLEREANVFAAEFLMPEPAVHAEFSRDGDVARQLRRLAGGHGMAALQLRTL